MKIALGSERTYL